MVFEVEIAPATCDDAVGIQEVFYRAWLVTYPNAEHGITVDDIEDRWKDRLSLKRLMRMREQLVTMPSNAAILVARTHGVVIGLVKAIAYTGANQLQAIYVLPTFHGHGIGHKLLLAVEKNIDRYKPTYVEVATYNNLAIRFYSRHGFADTGRRLTHERFTMKSGSLIPEMEMRRAAAMPP